MKRKYGVFLDHVGTFNDRYCGAYSSRPFTIAEKFERVKSIPLISSLNISMGPDYVASKPEVKELVKKYGFSIGGVMVDSTSNNLYKQGTYSNLDFDVRKQIVRESMDAMDFAEEIGCDLFEIWPGQDGYDYLFEADYIKERTLFAECLKELAAYKPNMKIGLEYKPREPRNYCYVNTMAGTMLMAQSTGCDNVGIVMDYGHSFYLGENPAEALAMCKMYGGKLFDVHMNDNYGGWDDDMIPGTVNTLTYLEFIYWLRKTGYTGVITFDQFPYREEARDAVAESAEWFDYLEGLVDKADPQEIESTLAKKDGVAASRLMRKLIRG